MLNEIIKFGITQHIILYIIIFYRYSKSGQQSLGIRSSKCRISHDAAQIAYIIRFKVPMAYYPPGNIARSVAMSLGNQGAPQSILASGTSFREDLVMKIFLRSFFLIR